MICDRRTDMMHGLETVALIKKTGGWDDVKIFI